MRRRSPPLKDFIRLQPRDARGYLLLGRAYLNRSLTLEAMPEIRKALALDPQLPLAHHDLGLAPMTLCKNAEALGEFRQEIQVNPSFAGAYWRAGTIELEHGRLPEAEEFLRRPRPKIRAKPPLTSSSHNAFSKSRSRKLPKPNIAGPSLWMPSSFAPTTAWLRPWGPWDEKKRRAGSFNFILSFWSATADRKVALRPRASRWQKHPCHHEIHRPEVVPSGQERNSLLTRIRDAVQGLTSRPELGVGRKGLTKLVRGLAVLVLFLKYQSQIVVRPGELRS